MRFSSQKNASTSPPMKIRAVVKRDLYRQTSAANATKSDKTDISIESRGDDRYWKYRSGGISSVISNRIERTAASASGSIRVRLRRLSRSRRNSSIPAETKLRSGTLRSANTAFSFIVLPFLDDGNLSHYRKWRANHLGFRVKHYRRMWIGRRRGYVRGWGAVAAESPQRISAPARDRTAHRRTVQFP